ncbi:NADP-specific glutamate dehydrogenase [Sporosarcina pasteurii]|uniref:Glutamate dehydrogenase n=1 Tax=Sporosarcina pasteurii TaxID=1474 RepID=A0A380C8I5_SPOPA|nr:NADP-specific glutamate dehydrogenase [Sporosarcina pasteurii]MDS9473028.1 NADP-specific glutamate dehydrogenase [Sporosarcina pasteurii]QBQ04537.1 NADP-specific glutamate dehydrogenase [Sporosarcina pasteurii]SUJ14197.1 NADP-specific glutamate dehydrogenase [Sporosarcina pasteurii]
MLTNINETYNDPKKLANDYVHEVYELIKKRNPGETEFLQATREIFDSLRPVFVKNPHYIEDGILERITEPDRIITFRVAWEDDQGKVHVNRGYRVQFNSELGPYKGGIRFHPSVNLSIMKFLAFEQIFKNSLTGQPIGAGKGGSDFDPKDKSEREIMRFIQSFMTEMQKYLGPDLDVPAGDIGVGRREVGYMAGQYNRIRGGFQPGVFTGKDPNYGGSLGRREATGYGTVYFTQEMLKTNGMSFEGKKVIVSGSGNVSTYAMEKAIELGATVIACSDSSGYIYDENGINVETIKRIKEIENDRIKVYRKYHSSAKFIEGCQGIWTIPCDIVIPCATQNELDEDDATLLIRNGVKAIAEGANMPCTQEAIDLFLENDILFAPAKAANAGGVAVSAMEMSQNSMRLSWTFEEVDEKLQLVMKDIYDNCLQAAEEYGYPGNLIVGANIAGFLKVANSMVSHGIR